MRDKEGGKEREGGREGRRRREREREGERERGRAGERKTETVVFSLQRSLPSFLLSRELFAFFVSTNVTLIASLS